MEPATIAALISLAGTAASAAGSIWGNKPAEQKQIPRFTPQQSEAQNALLMQALAGLQDPTKGFAPIEQQARSQFSQRTIPGIAERFAAADAQRSSGFQQALGQAGAGLEENLASSRAQYGQNQLSQLLNMLNLGLQPQFDTGITPAGKNAFGEFASMAGPMAMQFGLGSLTGAYGNQGNVPNPLNMPLTNFPIQSLRQRNMGTGFDLPSDFGQMPDLSGMWRQNLQNRGFGGFSSGSPYMYGRRS